MGLFEEILHAKGLGVDEDGSVKSLTEIEQMSVTKLAGVGTPASGAPFILCKSRKEDADPTGSVDFVMKVRRVGGDIHIDNYYGDAVAKATTAAASGSPESDDLLELVVGEVVEPEEVEQEAQPRHPDGSGRWISRDDLEDLTKGETMSKVRSEPNYGALAKRLEECHAQLPDGPLRTQVADELTLTRLRGLFSKGIVQDGLNGTAVPQAAGSDTSMGRSRAVGSVQQGTRVPASDSALTLGGQSTANIPLEAAVQTNPGIPATTDGAGIVNPQAMLKSIAQLEAKFAATADPIARQHVADELTKERLKLFYALKGVGGVGLSNNGGDVDPRVTGTFYADNVQAVSTAVKPEYLAKAQRKAQKKAAKRAIKRAMAA